MNNNYVVGIDPYKQEFKPIVANASGGYSEQASIAFPSDGGSAVPWTYPVSVPVWSPMPPQDVRDEFEKCKDFVYWFDNYYKPIKYPNSNY